MRFEIGEAIQSLAGAEVVLACAYTGRTREVAVASVVMVTSSAAAALAEWGREGR